MATRKRGIQNTGAVLAPARAPRGTTGAEAVAAVRGAERPSRKKNLEKVMYRLRPDQVQALRRLAFERAQETGSGRPDASEVLRELIDGKLDPKALQH